MPEDGELLSFRAHGQSCFNFPEVCLQSPSSQRSTYTIYVCCSLLPDERPDSANNQERTQGQVFSRYWFAGKTHVAPLVEEMLQRLNSEVNRYNRVITFWHHFGPDLEAAVCTVLRETTAAVTRQCGLVAVVSFHTLYVQIPISATDQTL